MRPTAISSQGMLTIKLKPIRSWRPSNTSSRVPELILTYAAGLRLGFCPGPQTRLGTVEPPDKRERVIEADTACLGKMDLTNHGNAEVILVLKLE
jgi:hypothetical protein